MATVELSRAEAREGHLPLVCMVCGQAGHSYRNNILLWFPWWVYLGIPLGLFPFVLFVLIGGDHRWIRAPLCELHRYHWLWRRAFSFGWLFLVLIVSVINLIVVVEVTVFQDKSIDSDDVAFVSFIVLLISGAGLIAWPFLALTLKYTGIYVTRVTPHSITLTPVPDEFVEALQVHRQDRRPNLDRAFGPVSDFHEG